jgi:hypothetical protein
MLDESYADGFDTGHNWKNNYVPGGPFNYSVRENESDLVKWLAMQSQAEHAAWMQGWHDGRAAQA